MLNGNCLNCGYTCVGWALHDYKYQICPNCGRMMDIEDQNEVIGPIHIHAGAVRYRLQLRDHERIDAYSK